MKFVFIFLVSFTSFQAYCQNKAWDLLPELLVQISARSDLFSAYPDQSFSGLVIYDLNIDGMDTLTAEFDSQKGSADYLSVHLDPITKILKVRMMEFSSNNQNAVELPLFISRILSSGYLEKAFPGSTKQNISEFILDKDERGRISVEISSLSDEQQNYLSATLTKNGITGKYSSGQKELISFTYNERSLSACYNYLNN